MARKVRRRGLFIAGVAVGAAAMYFLDPDRGHSRRVRGRDQLRARGRRRQRTRERHERYEEGVAEGLRHIGTEHPPVDDQALIDRVKSQLGHGFPRERVSLDAADGVLELRGELDSRDEIQALVERVLDVEGVTTLVSLLHLPGQPAPNKADALAASRRGGVTS